MKIKSLFFIIILSISIKKIQANDRAIICGKIISKNNFIIKIFEPIYGYYNIGFLDTTSHNSSLINCSDSICKILNIDKPVFITLYITNEKKQFITRADLLVFAGDSVHLVIDLMNPDDINSITYSGNNSEGQKLFNAINFQPYDKFIPVFDALDKLPENKQSFIKEIKNIPQVFTKRFDSLLLNDLVTVDFKTYMELTFKSLIYNQVVLSLLRESKKTNVISRSEKNTIINQLYEDQPPLDPRLNGLYLSYFYKYDYYGFLAYNKFNRKSLNEVTDNDQFFDHNNHKYLIRKDFVPFIYIDNKRIQIDLWALQMLSFYNYPGKYDFSLISQFDSIFPGNKWSYLLRKKYEPSDLRKKIIYKLQSPIKIIESNRIGSIADLTKYISAEFVFIDIWASWCGPCIAAFAYNDELDSFLNEKRIKRVYISFDGTDNKSKWMQAINKYKLGGYHILAYQTLIDDIRRVVYNDQGGNASMGIPRYVLIQNGSIIISDATSPTEIKLLKDEIKMFLKSINK